MLCHILKLKLSLTTTLLSPEMKSLPKRKKKCFEGWYNSVYTCLVIELLQIFNTHNCIKEHDKFLEKLTKNCVCPYTGLETSLRIQDMLNHTFSTNFVIFMLQY